MEFDIEKDFGIFQPVLDRHSDVSPDGLKHDLGSYYLPFVQKLFDAKKQKGGEDGLIVGVSAIQGAGKTVQGEVLEILLSHFGHSTVSLSIDDHYITHDALNTLREKDPRFIRRGLTHDIPLAITQLHSLKTMEEGSIVKAVTYDKGAHEGDGDRNPESLWRVVSQKPEFIFYNGWMLGARRVRDESIFESGLPALDTSERIQFAKDCNRRLDDYIELWGVIDFMNVLYVPDYRISFEWRDKAEEKRREEGRGMSREQIREFVDYFWRSVHPAIQIKNLAQDIVHTQQVVIVNDDHSTKEILTPEQVRFRYP